MSDMTARQIKWHRKRNGMTQAELADKVGVSVMSIRRYETIGENNREPSAELFNKIAYELGVTTNILLGKVDNYEFVMEVRDPKEHGHLHTLRQLTDEGKEKVYKYAEDMALIKDYRADGRLPLKYRLGKVKKVIRGNKVTMKRENLPDPQESDCNRTDNDQ